MGLDFRVLGPLEVAREGRPLRLGVPKQRALLTLLLVEAGELVPAERIVEEVWHGARGGSVHSVQAYVSELRKLLGDPERIRGEAGGYLLAAASEEIDARRFERLVDEGRRLRVSGEPARAVETLRAALGLWRGAPLADLAYEPLAQAESGRLEELRLDASEELIDAELALGRHREVLPEIEALVAAEPLRERPRRMLMLALYRSGRQAEALDAYRDARRTLVDELGIEPGSELKELEAAILRQEPSLLVEPAELRARRHLPTPATELVGRRREVDEVVDLLQDGSRLVTLTGPGGTGKTRVGLQAAYELAERFEDGVFFVGLAALRDPDLVPHRIARALGVEARERAVLDELASRLRGRRTLLLVDNFEQVDKAAPALASLLSDAPALNLLVTSRHPLRVYGEHEFPVAPLTLDDEAVPLFLQRAAATGRQLGASEEVRDICRRLDCLPLAIELAATRAREFGAAEMREMLASRLDLAAEGPRDVPARQQTLRATIEWSYDLLGESEQQLFAGSASSRADARRRQPLPCVTPIRRRSPRSSRRVSSSSRRAGSRCWRRFASTRSSGSPQSTTRPPCAAGTASTSCSSESRQSLRSRGRTPKSGLDGSSRSTTISAPCSSGRSSTSPSGFSVSLMPSSASGSLTATTVRGSAGTTGRGRSRTPMRGCAPACSSSAQASRFGVGTSRWRAPSATRRSPSTGNSPIRRTVPAPSQCSA